jgi:hypothetical protein
MDDLVKFGSGPYCVLSALLFFARGMDILSTWIATPNLILEANPIAKKLGWKWGIALNMVMCLVFAIWPLPAIVIITTSMLVAARNLQSAWIMRTLGEHQYRSWMTDCLDQTPFSLYLFCLLGQTVMLGALGGALMYFSGRLVPFAIGMGFITYAVAITGYTLLSVWRLRRRRV